MTKTETLDAAVKLRRKLDSMERLRERRIKRAKEKALAQYAASVREPLDSADPDVVAAAGLGTERDEETDA